MYVYLSESKADILNQNSTSRDSIFERTKVYVGMSNKCCSYVHHCNAYSSRVFDY